MNLNERMEIVHKFARMFARNAQERDELISEGYMYVVTVTDDSEFQRKCFHRLKFHMRSQAAKKKPANFTDCEVSSPASNIPTLTRLILEESLQTLTPYERSLIKAVATGQTVDDLHEQTGIPAATLYYQIRQTKEKLR